MVFLLAVVSGFASGVFLRSLFFTSWWPIIFILLIATLFYFVPKLLLVYEPAPLEREPSSSLMGFAAVFFIFVALGMVRAAVSDTPLPSSFASDIRHRVTYEGIVVSDPDMRDTNQRMQISVTKEEESTRVLAVTSRNTDVAVGDIVNVSGTLLVPEPFADDNGRTFRYDKYLQRDGVQFIMNYAYIRIESRAPWYSVMASLARAKHAFTDGVNVSLSEPYSSLSSGIVIGGKSGLGNELKDAFTRSGLIHIVVLSGHNVMIVASWVIAFFIFVFAKVESVFGKRVPRMASVVAGALALILFVGIAGASATAIRAALMALIALYARATGKTYAAGRALLFVILLMLVWNPLYLVFDPGFGLSVVATAGLIWLAPLVELWLVRIKNEFLRNAVATTLSAQIAVLPLLLYQTGNLSLVAIPANVVVALLVPFAMAFSYLAGFGGMLFGSTALTASGSLSPIISIAIGMPAYFVGAVLIWIAETSAALPLAAFILPPFPFWLTLLAYAGLIYLVRQLADQKRFSITDQFKFAKKASI
ncbi:ComEC/Rec2 family competence protein [Candidatus Kaiserbacteria bacterium]|nr:ComEC/Rec2 family competence protein [Candidatus Kaiserbacteria bacterium]